MSFFFDGYFCLLISELKKKHDVFFFGCPGQRPGPPLVALPGYLRPTRQRFPPLVVLVQVQPSPERWKLRRRRNPGRSRNGTRPRVAGENTSQGEVFFPREWSFFF